MTELPESYKDAIAEIRGNREYIKRAVAESKRLRAENTELSKECGRLTFKINQLRKLFRDSNMRYTMFIGSRAIKESGRLYICVSTLDEFKSTIEQLGVPDLILLENKDLSVDCVNWLIELDQQGKLMRLPSTVAPWNDETLETANYFEDYITS